jgi:PKHD-type hydroxylase
MAVILANILTQSELSKLQQELSAARWTDGASTAGGQARAVKVNQQLGADDPVARRGAELVTRALARHTGFLAAALPRRHTMPMFSRYESGQSYGMHIDNALRLNGSERLRTDLAATLFLSDPASYDGGELTIETGLGTPSVKLPAGHMILYPATTRHRVTPVTRGSRMAAILWVQSMVRDERQRELLLDLDRSIQTLSGQLGANNPQLVALTGTYHNLLRLWLEA